MTNQNHKNHVDNITQAEHTNDAHQITQALNSIIRELKLSSLHQWGDDYDPDYLNDIDTSSLESFKNTFTHGSGWNWGTREEFIDLFGCGNTYEFKFTKFECNLLDNEFDVIMTPSMKY